MTQGRTILRVKGSPPSLLEAESLPPIRPFLFPFGRLFHNHTRVTERDSDDIQVRPHTKGLNPMRMLIALLAAALVCGVATPAPARQDKKMKIVFVVGGPSHGYGDHEHLGGCMLLAKALNESGL